MHLHDDGDDNGGDDDDHVLFLFSDFKFFVKFSSSPCLPSFALIEAV